VIISDMEGVSGVVRWEQVIAGRPMYEEGRRLYTEDVNAAIRGAFTGGATDVVVMDWHGAGGGYSFNSLIPDALDSRCRYVVQERVPQYTRILEDGCDAALLVGMHARAGTVDGTLVGEPGINAALCGTWGCPVVLVTGDEATCEQTRELLGEAVAAVPVKRGIGRTSAVLVPPVRARQMIEAGAAEALSRVGSARPYDPGRPCEIVVEFQHTAAWEEFRHRHGVEDAGERRIRCTGPDWWTAWSSFMQVAVYTGSV
jgi:D-amino peptidase